MDASASEYDKKFSEMQQYIPFLENMIERLRNVDKPRAPQLDKIQSLYNIVTNTKKKLKYETLIKCEEGLKKLYEKVGKTDNTIKSLNESCNNEPPSTNTSRPQNTFDCSSAPASPSPPSTPEPTPKAPILIPTERRISPIRDIRPIIDRQPTQHNDPQLEDLRVILDRRHSRDKKGRYHDSPTHKHKHHTKSEDDKRRNENNKPTSSQSDLDKRPSSTDSDFGIYNKGIVHKSKTQEPILSPPPNEPPLTSADLEDLLSDSDSKNNEQLDVSQLENIREQLLSQINDLSGTATPPGDDKYKKTTDKKKETKLEKPSSTSKVTEKANDTKVQLKSKSVEKIKESSNKFGNLLSSIDDQIFEQKKKDLKKVENVKKESKVKIEKTDKIESFSKTSDKSIKPSDKEQPKSEKKDEDSVKNKLDPSDNQTENDVNKPETPYVRLADKYQRKPRTDKNPNDVVPSDDESHQPPINITGRGLTMKELERFGPFEAHEKVSTFPLPPNNNNTPIFPNDPRLKRATQQVPPQMLIQNSTPWQHQSNQNIHPKPPLYPDLYASGPPGTPQDPFSSRNMFNNIQVPIQDNVRNIPSLMQSFNHNKNFHPFNQNLQSQYDLSKMNPINYYENPNQYHSTNQSMKPYSSKTPLLSPPPNQSPLYNMNQNLYNIQNIPSLLNTVPKPPPPPLPVPPPSRIEPVRTVPVISSRDPRDPRRRAYDNNVERSRPESTVDRYGNRNTNRSTTEKKVFRGYDPRPVVRKKEPEKVNHSDMKIDGISNIPTPGALNSFKIPKIKREEPKIVETKDDKLVEDDKKEVPVVETSDETTIKKDIDDSDSNNTVTQNPEISSNSNENEPEIKEKVDVKEKDKGNSKEDVINNFVRKLWESGETEVFLALLESLGEKINRNKMNKIINKEDSIESDDIEKKSLKTNEEKEQNTVDSSTSDVKDDDNTPEEVVQSSSSPGTSRETDKPKKGTEKSTKEKSKRRTDLEMLQDDIRDMFICKGVLTATGQRMCRLFKEDQDEDLTSLSLNNAMKKNLRNRKDTSEDEISSPPRRTRVTRQSKNLDNSLTDTKSEVSPQRRTRQPRVVIEKSDFDTIKSRRNSTSSVSSLEEVALITENVPKSNKTQRKTNKLAKKENRELIIKTVENIEDINVSSLFLKRNLKKRLPTKQKPRSKVILSKKIADAIESLINSKKFTLEYTDLKSIFEKSDTDDDSPKKVVRLPGKNTKGKRKKINRRGKAWSTGVIKKKPVPKKITENDELQSEQMTNETETEAEESVDSKPSINYTDKDYCFNGSGKYSCKLCSFSGKTIVFHYKSIHPSEEILISRMPQDTTKICVDESIENNYETMILNEEVSKCAGHRRKRFKGFDCRFCDYQIKNEFTQTFYDHIATHTGENSFGCTLCKFTTISKPSLRAHVSYSHPGKKFTYTTLYPPCKNYSILFGYLCGECNFVQLHEDNVKQHVKRYHSDKLTIIYKVNLSSLKNETVDQKPVQKKEVEVEKKNESTSSTLEDDNNTKSDLSSTDENPLNDIEDKTETNAKRTDNDVDLNESSENKSKNKKINLQTDQEQLNEETTDDHQPPVVENVIENVEDISEKVTAVEQKERELNVFVCPDDLPDEQKIQDERLKKMQEVADAVCQTRRTSVQFLDTLKLKLELKENCPEEKTMDVEPVSSTEAVSSSSVSTSANEKSTTSINNDISSSLNSSKNSPEKVKTASKNVEISQIFDNDDDLDAGLIDEVLNMENDWSKWNSSSKSNSTMMNTIQRLASVVKQNASDSCSTTIKYHVGPVSAEKTNNIIQYSCSPNILCSFTTTNKDQFTSHVTEKHLDFWDGECSKCEENIDKSSKLTCKDALEHLFKVHLELTDVDSSDSSRHLAVKPVIRMRKLSGDKLSVTMSPDRNFTDTDSNTSGDLILKNIVSLSDSLQTENSIEFKIQDVRTLNPDEIESPKPKKSVFSLSPIKASPLSNKFNSTTVLTTVPIIVQTTKKINKGGIATVTAQTPKAIKPWSINKQMLFKDAKVISKMLEPTRLAHIFKCMAKYCDYTTDEGNAFLWHLNTVKTPMHMDAKDWGMCPYCPEINIPTSRELELHILQEHGECRFQCGFCFYRAASQSVVERHQCELHGPENFRVYQLDIRTDYNEYKKQLPLSYICKPYICPYESCDAEIYLKENLFLHMKTHPDMQSFECKICHEKRSTCLNLIQHFPKHHVGLIQCLYCLYCAEYEHTMKTHLGSKHPNQSPKVLFRKVNPALKPPEPMVEPMGTEAQILRYLLICNLDLQTTHFSTAIPIPSTPPNYNFAIKNRPQSGRTASSSLNDNILLLFNENESTPIKDTNFEEVIDDTDENSHLNELIESTLKETENGGKINTNLDIFSDLKEKGNSKEMDIPLVVDLENSDVDEEDIEAQVDPLAIEEVQIPSVQKKIPDAKNISKEDDEKNDNDESQKQNINSIDDIIDTGLSGKALYRCGTTNCEFSSDTLANFKDHLFVCDTSNDSSLFRCYHCKKSIKYITSLIDHIKRHGLTRYGCSLCDYRSAVASYVAKHMKEKHKISTVRTIPLDPFKADIENDLFVVCPQGKTTTLKRKTSNRDLSNEHTTAVVKMIFAPHEVDLLPRQPISPFDMKCGQCLYTTKVRTNMVRHLLFHTNSIAVPESAPVNPVPCLEKNEKMFDKMVNLANSSFTAESKMGTKPVANRKSSISNEDLQDLPCFVPENKRFVCGANGCNYLTVDESMLRCHFRALHMDEINFKCPHCNDQLGIVVPIDKIGVHLKMHDTRLYKCSHCPYYHYQKYVVDRHLSEKHSDKVPYVHVVRELDADGKDERKETNIEIPADVAGGGEIQKDNKPWKCGLCKFKTVTRTEIIEHARTSHAVKSQFMCSLCQYKCSYDKTFERHFNAKHPGQSVDMISVYYKEDTPVVEPVSTSIIEQFDTTPLWRRDMPRIRHIRGILFEETKQVSPRKSKTDANKNTEEAIEYVMDDYGPSEAKKRREENNSRRRKSIATVSSDLDLSDLQSDINEDLVNRSFELKLSYSCTICNKFKVVERKEFAEHLCQEMNYEKFICTYCSKKSHSFDWMKGHLDTAHGKPWKPEFIVSLTVDDSIETFILNEINRQEQELYGINYKKINNLKEIFGCPPDNRHSNVTKHFESNPVHTDDKSIEDSSDYEEIEYDNETKQSKSIIKKVKTAFEESFIDPRQTDKNRCPHCSYFSKYPRDVTKHILRHWEEQPYKCGNCAFKGNAPAEIIKHSIQKHIKTKVIKLCDPKSIKIRDMQRSRRKAADPLDESPERKKIRDLNSSTASSSSSSSMFEKCQLVNISPTKITPVVDISPTIGMETEEHLDVVQEEEQSINEPSSSVSAGSVSKPTLPKTKVEIVYLCHYCPKQGTTVKIIYEHWMATHKEKSARSIFKFRTMGKSQLPTRVRGRVLCKICGYRGSRQNVLKHHKLAHPGKRLQIDDSPRVAVLPVKPSVRINCKECLFYCYSLVMMEPHYVKVHPTSDFKTKFAEELNKEKDKTQNEQQPTTAAPVVVTVAPVVVTAAPVVVTTPAVVTKPSVATKSSVVTKPSVSGPVDTSPVVVSAKSALVQCKWCQEICKDEDAAKSHHLLFHSHLKFSTTPVKSVKRYCCPKCPHTSESHVAIMEHLRGHVKPYVCCYCNLNFGILRQLKVHTIKDHPGLDPSYETDSKKIDEFAELKTQLKVVSEDGTSTLLGVNDSTKYKRPLENSEESPNKVIILSSDVIKKTFKAGPVAKKSTTFIPEYMRVSKKVAQVAKKSTTPHVKPIIVTTPSSDAMSAKTSSEEKEYYSFYGTKPVTDNSNITTTMNLGGTQMKVNIPTLMHLTNMVPIIRVADLKNQKMIL